LPNTNGCDSVVRLSLSIFADLQIDSINILQYPCMNDDNGSVMVHVTGEAPPFTYRWSCQPPQFMAIATHLPAGIYTVTVTDAYNNHVIATIEIFSHLLQADFSIAQLPPYFTFHYLQFHDLSNGQISQYWWNFGDGETSSAQNPLYSYERTGEYEVVLTISNADGCKDSTSLLLNLLGKNDLFIPNAFTPDGDGLNDAFMPIFTCPERITFYELKIYNRWGRLIFHSTDPNTGWTGDNYESAVYTYYIEYMYNSDKRLLHKEGRVTLVKF
jgi:gliding motility-associated-like protein